MGMRIQCDRVLHMHGVAEYMYANAARYDLDPANMYLLGYLHDIGYLFGKEEHELKGAELVGLDSFYGKLIAAHGLTPRQFAEYSETNEKKIPAEMILLWEADMMVDLTGEAVGYEKRLEGIAERHGKESRVYRRCYETIDWLKKKGCERESRIFREVPAEEGTEIQAGSRTPSKARRDTTCYDHLGNKYKSTRQMCMKYNIDPHVFGSRMRHGWSLEEALIKDVYDTSFTDLNGTRFPNRKAAAEAYGISEKLLSKRIRDGWEINEALRTPPWKKRPS